VMVEEFAHSLAASKQLSIYKSIVFNYKPFSVKAACKYVCNIKNQNADNIEERYSLNYAQSVLIIDNMHRCFASLKQVNQFIERMQGLAKTAYDPTLPTHTTLLTQLWKGLMPSQRVPELANSDDWGLIGFQGKDPGTDFRGMGLLGLMQLQWFATHDGGNGARKVLNEANHETRYFPMCATGINISYLCLEMLLESRLHRCLFDCIIVEPLISENKTENEDKVADLSHEEINHETMSLLSAQLGDTGYGTAVISPSSSPMLLCSERYHQFYCDTYLAWTKFWVSMNPKDIMAFPALFKEFSIALRKQYDKL